LDGIYVTTATKSSRTQALKRIRDRAARSVQPEQMMLFVAEELATIPNYNWVGFYLLSHNDPEVLELGPFVGASTEHTRIPLNQGICGAAVSNGKTMVVDDVSSDPRYLSCSLETKSEIVVPIWALGKIVGELDIDSHTLAAFGAEDRALVEECAAIVGCSLEAGGK
jgi:GAF domain-containing protein